MKQKSETTPKTKFAVLADIHGNSEALVAVLEDMGRRRIEQAVNLGDVLYGPLWPGRTYELLQPLHALTVRGNQDREIVEARGAGRPANATMSHVLDDLPAASFEWLRLLPLASELSHGILLCHGTPQSDATYLLEDITRGIPEVRPEQAIIEHLGSVPHRLILCGHSHVPRAVRLSNGVTVVNPGSVGLPAYEDASPVHHRMETCSPSASYAVVESGDSGWIIELVSVPYDHQSAAAEARKNGREDWACQLATGRVAR